MMQFYQVLILIFFSLHAEYIIHIFLLASENKLIHIN